MSNSFLSVMGIFALVALLCNFAANAQSTSFGISAEMAVPQFAPNTMSINILPGVDLPLNFVDFGSASQAGFGFVGNVQHTLANEKVALLAKAGVLNWKVMDEGLLQANVQAIPITVGGRYYAYEGFYAGVDVGANMVTSKLKATMLLSLGNSTTETLVSFAPNIGYQLDLGKTKVDLGAKYAFVGNKFNYFGITAGINFPTGK